MKQRSSSSRRWDLSSLLNAATSQNTKVERNLWFVHLFDWLRRNSSNTRSATSQPLLRLRQLLNVMDSQESARDSIAALIHRLWFEADTASLLADFGFSSRGDLMGEIGTRLSLNLLPATPDSDDLSTLFELFFTSDADPQWLSAIEERDCHQLAHLLVAAAGCAHDWLSPVRQAMHRVATAIAASAFSPDLRQRMDKKSLSHRPFQQLLSVVDKLVQSLEDKESVVQQVAYLRALLVNCRQAARSVLPHLDEHGVSVAIVFEYQQLLARLNRLEALVDITVSDNAPRSVHLLLVDLVRTARGRRSLWSLLTTQYALLARKIAERHAERGEHYIVRGKREYLAMLRRAWGGGAMLALTTLAKFSIVALALSPWWEGVASSVSYAASFVAIYLLHWTVATKQPAMTASALADKLGSLQEGRPDAARQFTDEVTHLIRSQMAGIIGNLTMVIPVVLLLQLLTWYVHGTTFIGPAEAKSTLHHLTLLGPTALFAAITGVLLFLSSLIAGWVENWFVFHRLESALRHHPFYTGLLGTQRASRWAQWLRDNISGLSSNISLGFLLGLVPPLLSFIGLPIEVRHVTLSTGQLTAAASVLGWNIFHLAQFWWCVAGIVVIGFLNLTVSFYFALRLSLRARAITVQDRQLLQRAILSRLLHNPRSFFLP